MNIQCHFTFVWYLLDKVFMVTYGDNIVGVLLRRFSSVQSPSTSRDWTDIHIPVPHSGAVIVNDWFEIHYIMRPNWILNDPIICVELSSTVRYGKWRWRRRFSEPLPFSAFFLSQFLSAVRPLILLLRCCCSCWCWWPIDTCLRYRNNVLMGTPR